MRSTRGRRRCAPRRSKERFKFKTENDEESRRFLFPTLAAMAAKAYKASPRRH